MSTPNQYKPDETVRFLDFLEHNAFFAKIYYESREPLKLHPVVRELLHMPQQAISPHALFKLPHIDPDANADHAYCLIRQKSYEGYDPDTDKFTRVKLGRILRQIFPQMPQVAITQEVERFTAASKLTLQFTQSDEELKELMLWMTKHYYSADEAPYASVPVPCSCMNNPKYIGRLTNCGIHPYQVYAHALGWSLAYIPVDPEDYTKGILARAVVNNDGQNKCFVRTYAAKREYQTSERLEHLLIAQGYEHVEDWAGYSIAKIDCIDLGLYGDIVAPFIDGESDYYECNDVRVADMDTLQVRRDKLELSQFSSVFSACSAIGMLSLKHRCEKCNAPTDDDTLCTVGRNRDEQVCVFCRREFYTLIYSKEIWVANDEAIKLHDGGTALLEDAVYIERLDECWHVDDVVYSEVSETDIPCKYAVQLYDGRWAWMDESWRDYMGDWHANDEPYVVEDATGLLYTEADYESLMAQSKQPNQPIPVGEHHVGL